jgi:hypothetical protein
MKVGGTVAVDVLLLVARRSFRALFFSATAPFFFFCFLAPERFLCFPPLAPLTWT